MNCDIFCGVQDFKLEKYLGKWYQIAAFPSFFYNKDYINVTAEYSEKNDSIKVVNTASIIEENGNILIAEATGKAVIMRSGIFGVNFDDKKKFFPNYYIIQLRENDEQYVISVVSDPSMKNLYILSRNAAINIFELKEILKYLYQVGFDISALIYTHHTS